MTRNHAFTEKDYQDLLELAGKEYDMFSLVWREDFDFNPTASDIEVKLQPYLVKTEYVSSWPGTETEGSHKMNFYSINNHILTILSSHKNVFNWLAPDFPEDLAFYKNNTIKFASVAHEKMAWYE